MLKKMSESPILLDGRKVAALLEKDLKQKIVKIGGRAPHLTVFLVGNAAASELYVARKKEACLRVGISVDVVHLSEQVSEQELIDRISDANQDVRTDGILVQLPLPATIRPLAIHEAIDPEKDVDGFHPINMGKLLLGITDGFIPCTPLGVKMLLDAYQISVTGKHVVILGRSNIVGKPMGALFSQITPGFDATVTILHRDSPDFVPICLTADILIVAVGRPRQIQPHMLRQGVVIVDVGIHRIEGEKIVGDVDYDKVRHLASYITPVPGGVGPMTIAALLENCYRSYTKS